MSGTILNCTVCGATNMFPIPHANMQQRQSLMTFCSTCGSVTLQRVSKPLNEGGNEEIINQENNLPVSLEGPLVNSPDPYTRVPLPQDSKEQLWKRLQDTLINNGVSMIEFFRCDKTTQMKIISAVGFNNSEVSQLLQMTELKNPRKIIDNTGNQGEQPVELNNDSYSPLPVTPSQNKNSKNETINSIENEKNPIMKTPPPSSTRNDTSVIGLTKQEDGTLVAKCSVYPNLPAEYWCSLCGVLVSSKCHVTGIHKDHPFITLRQAAEAHVRDLKTWSERCRSQMNVANTIVSNLNHGKEVLNGSIKHQEEELDQNFEEIIRGLSKWRDELKSSIRLQIDAQLKNIDSTLNKSNDLINYYNEKQKNCEPLLHSIPPMHQNDKQSEDWSLRVMDLVTNLKISRREPIPMPRLTIPEIKCLVTAATYMDLLKAVSIPAGIRIPDVLDTGYLNFPHPSDVGREAFTLQLPDDYKARGLLLYSGRTITRSQDITPSHSLICASQIFYTGLTGWEVHVDRLGAGPGRVLAGVLMAGTEGEGVVWDGQRIVGPNEGECRVLPERYRLQTGTTLRFVLELEAPSYFLICYFEEEVVARVPLPPALHGWIPSFSVFGPQDQITVVPTSTTATEHLLSTANPELKEKEVEETAVRLIEQEQKLNALQQQLLAVNSRIDQDQYDKIINNSKIQSDVSGIRENSNNNNTNINLSPPPISQSFKHAMTRLPKENEKFSSQSPVESIRVVGSSSPSMPTNELRGYQSRQEARNDSYSPELRNLLKFVESIK